MSAIWGVLGNSIDEEKVKQMRKSMEIFPFDRVVERRDRLLYMACGHQVFSKESVNNRSPFEENEIILNSDCILYNRKELLDELGTDQKLSDDEIISKLYQKEGERFVQKLRGSFSIVIYNCRLNEILIYTDHFSRRTIFYLIQNGGLFFSTVMQPLRAYFGKKLELNERYIAAAYGDCTSDSSKILGETVYKNVFVLTAGQYIKYHVDTQELEKFEYYNPLKIVREERHSRDEWKDIFLDTFAKTTRRFLITTGHTGIMLSGGLDSSAVAAMTAPALKERNESLYTYTQVPVKDFKGERNRFEVNDETDYIRQQERFHGNMICSFVDADGDNVFYRLEELTRLYMQPVKPCINLTMITAILDKAREDGCTLMLSGQNGNATISYGDILSYVYQKLVSLNVYAAYKEMQSFCNFRKIGRKQFLKVFVEQYRIRKKRSNFVEDDCFIKNDIIKKYSLINYWKRLDKNVGEGLFDSDLQHKNFIFFPRMYQQMGYYDTYNSLKYGMIFEDPTLTPEVMELCLAMPMECFVHNGRERAVVRDFFKGLIPDCILENHLSRGKQAADFEFRLNRDWDKVKEQVYGYLEKEYIFEYFDRKVVEELVERVKNNEKKLSRSDAVLIAVLSALSSFLMNYYD